jgi:hypothetical protein
MIVWIWLLISVTWFSLNFYFIERHDFSFWFVGLLPFAIGLLFFIGAGLAAGSWRKPPDHLQY